MKTHQTMQVISKRSDKALDHARYLAKKQPVDKRGSEEFLGDPPVGVCVPPLADCLVVSRLRAREMRHDDVEVFAIMMRTLATGLGLSINRTLTTHSASRRDLVDS
jgi:hypothetical protein